MTINKNIIAASISLFLIFTFASNLSCKKKNKFLNNNKNVSILKLDVSKKPSETNLNWLKVIGKYKKMEGFNDDSFLIRELDQKLYIQINAKDYELLQQNYKLYTIKEVNPLNTTSINFIIDKKGNVPLCKVKDIWYEKETFLNTTIDFLQLSHPKTSFIIDDPSLIEITKTDPTIMVDLKLAKGQKAYLKKEAAKAILLANKSLEEIGYSLVILDAYRPRIYTNQLILENPSLGNQSELTGYEDGYTVSLCLFNRKSNQLLSMGSPFLEFSERSFVSYTGGTSLERWNRDLLKTILEKVGFIGSENIWWKFSYKVVH